MGSKNTDTDANFTSLQPSTNNVGPKIVETVTKIFVDSEEKQAESIFGLQTVTRDASGHETIVEREIREQREREDALASQRAAAVSLRNETSPDQILHGCDVANNEEKNKISIKRNTKNTQNTSFTADAGIVFELNSMDSELKFVEVANDSSKKDIVNTLDAISYNFLDDVNPVSNSSSSEYTIKDAWQTNTSHINDSSQDECESTNSSVSIQNNNTGSNSPRGYHSTRNSLVKPLSEPEDDTSRYIRWQKETPIEREIRLNREREEELRREKGLSTPINNSASSIRRYEGKKLGNRKTLALNDCRSVQHRIATSRIQQEIKETTDREKELHAAGLIQTISEDTVDSKVTRITDLAGFAIEETERKLRRAVSSSSISKDPENQVNETNVINSRQPTAVFKSLFDNISNHSSGNTLNSPKKQPPNIGRKGIMQRFLASHGKVSPGGSQNWPKQFTPVHRNYEVSSSPNIKQKNEAAVYQTTNDSLLKNVRHGYLSAEEKIQAELQEMQKREEELRLQRAKLFAHSQPDLSTIGKFEEYNGNHQLKDFMTPTFEDSESLSQTVNSNGE